MGIFAGVGKPINTAPLDSLFGYTASIGIRPVLEMSCEYLLCWVDSDAGPCHACDLPGCDVWLCELPAVSGA